MPNFGRVGYVAVSASEIVRVKAETGAGISADGGLGATELVGQVGVQDAHLLIRRPPGLVSRREHALGP